MKTNISHLQAAPTNDLLNLPDIDGVFQEVKGPTAPPSSQAAPKATQPDIPAICPAIRLSCQEV